MKKTFYFVIATLAFALGCFAVDLSPPPKVEKQLSFKKIPDHQSVSPVNFDQNQKFYAENKLVENQKAKVTAVSYRKETPTGREIKLLTAKTNHKSFDLPPNLPDNLGFDGNVADQIRAQPTN